MVPTANTRAVSPDLGSLGSEADTTANGLLRWCPTFREARTPDSIHLFCFPFAGGGASAFANWPASFPDQVIITPIQYPGREARWSEAGFSRLADLIEALTDDLTNYWPNRFAFLGHSFGALVAYELARSLKQRGHPGPMRLFVAGARGPHLPPLVQLHGLPDDDFLAKLRKYNGLPDAVLEHQDLIAAVLPTIKDDFRLLETHDFQVREPLPTPISVFGGLGDQHVSIPDLLSWSCQTSKAFRSRFLKGHHFFLFDSVSAISTYVTEDLKACSA